jgi:hypothetical protein
MNKVALLVRTDGTTERVEYNSDTEYSTLSGGVGGFIEAVTLSNDLILWVNEEGKMNGLPINTVASRWYDNRFGAGYDIMVGNAVFTGGVDEEGYTNGLTESQLTAIEEGAKHLVGA